MGLHVDNDTEFGQTNCELNFWGNIVRDMIYFRWRQRMQGHRKSELSSGGWFPTVRPLVLQEGLLSHVSPCSKSRRGVGQPTCPVDHVIAVV